MSEYEIEQAKCGIRPGDLVIVTRSARSHEKGWDEVWVEEMDMFVGRVCRVECIRRWNSGISLYSPNPHQLTSYNFPYFVLTRLMPELPRGCSVCKL